MIHGEAYHFVEDYLVPVYVAPYETYWLAACNGNEGGHTYQMNLIAVRAEKGAERESMKAAIFRDIEWHKHELAARPNNPHLMGNLQYLERIIGMFDTIYEKEIRHVHPRWQEMNADTVRILNRAGMTQFNVSKAVFFTGIAGKKVR